MKIYNLTRVRCRRSLGSRTDYQTVISESTVLIADRESSTSDSYKFTHVLQYILKYLTTVGEIKLTTVGDIKYCVLKECEGLLNKSTGLDGW